METQAKVLKQSSGTLLKLLLISLLPMSAFANPLVQSWQNRTTSHEGLLLEPRISYFNTTTNFDSTSTALTLPNQNTVTRFYFDLNLTYHLEDDWFLFGRVSGLSSKVKSSGIEYSKSGLGDQLVGLAHRLVSDPNGLNFSVQLEATLPAYQNPTTGTDPFMGDQSTDLTVGGFIELPISRGSDLWIEAGAGYTYRNRNFSAAIPYSVMLKKDPEGKGFLFSIGARGQFSLQTDNTLPSVAIVDQLRGAGGSYLINAVNPSFAMAQGQVGFKTASSTEFYALVAAPLVGKNAASGIQASLGMQFDFGAPQKRVAPRNENNPLAAPVAVQAPKKKLSTADLFTTYDLEAEVTSVNDQLYLAKLNKGLEDGIEKGQVFDIFAVTEDTVTQRKSETPIARVKVSNVKNNEAAVTVIEYYRDQWIEKGFVARRVVQ